MGDYEQNKEDLNLALPFIRKALETLRDYYSSDGAATAMLQQDSNSDSFLQQPPVPEHHEKKSDAGAMIIQILEKVESDLSENLAKLETEEADAEQGYDEFKSESKITEEGTESDLKYDK